MENDKNKKKSEQEIFEDIKFDEILDPSESKMAEREPTPPKKQRRVKKKPLNNRDYVHTYKYYSVEAKEHDEPMKTVDNKEENNNNQALNDFLKLRARKMIYPLSVHWRFCITPKAGLMKQCRFLKLPPMQAMPKRKEILL